jgi:hypothetical protein
MPRDQCPGCGALLPDDPNGPHHAYVITSSGCWEAFSRLSAREFEDPAWSTEHRLSVDTYMAQHPDGDDRRQRQSVAVHLIALCHRLEHDLDPATLLAATRSLASHRDWPRLEPVPRGYRLTVLDVLEARTPAQHAGLVQAWAEGTWSAWSEHHPTIRGWADASLAAVRHA